MTSERESQAGNGMYWRLPVAFAVLVAGLVAVAGLAPGGLGEPGRVVVDRGWSAWGFAAVVVADGPGHDVLEKGAAAGLLVLGGLLLWAGWRGRADVRVLAGTLLTLGATVAAYATSEALKLVVDEERPCRVPSLSGPAADCPAPGDWSFPSNHATLAAALAAGIALLRPRLAVAAVAVAAGVGLLRVVAGVHYPHDVLAGAALGGALSAAAGLALTPVVAWLLVRVRLAELVGSARPGA